MIRIFITTVLLSKVLCIFDIEHFGAIANQDHLSAQRANTRAIIEAIKAANSTTTEERVVRISNKKYYSMPIRLQYVHNVSILILGKLIASQNIEHWPRLPQMQKFYEDFLSFRHSTDIEITGGGRIDGRGYPWWILLFHNNKKYLPDQNGRPMLVHFIDCNRTKINDLILKNSPQFHLKYDECHDGRIENLAIKVNTTAQLRLVKYFQYKGWPFMFPFNTDGIDPSGARFHIYNLSVQNFDDVVVPKPLDDNFDCTRDIWVENVTAKFGIGMAIGSLSPSAGRDCIRNVTAVNWKMIRPIKAIYVKSNPGHEGTGIIENLYFKNFTMYKPIWWPIYIGPQQMKEPDGDGPGCMFYPFGKGICQTEPRVTIRNITIQNVRIHNSVFFPYTIRCNVTNPCKDINFYNVQTDKWRVGQKQTGYLCEYVMGKGRDNVPKIHCLDQVEDQLQKDEDFGSGEEERRPSLMEWAFEESLTAMKLSKLIFDEIEQAVDQIGYQQQDDQVDYHSTPSALYRKILATFQHKLQ